MLAKSSVNKRRVLLVDDEPLILATIGQVLRNAGYETAEADSGEAAQQIALEFQPDMALLDVVLTGISGLELARFLKAETSIPFMFISASAEVEIVRQATEYGAVGYLLKPFDIAQIIPAFEAALSRADEIRRLRSSENNLTIALNSGRETSMAVGLLMARFGADRHTAFEVLRAYARSNRSKMNEVAESLLAAEEMFNTFKALFSKQGDG
jgi:AmiR/NasT family two-component response regulator